MRNTKFQREVNIFSKEAILKRFKANETKTSVLQGKIETLISESEITELQNGKVTMYSKLADVKLTVDGLSQEYSDISSKYDSVSGRYTSLDAKVAEYKSSVDGLTQNLSHVQADLKNNYSTTTAMNAAIKAGIDGLSSTVSKTYATASDVQQKLTAADSTAKGYADAAKQAAVNTAKASTDELLKSYATVKQMQSAIDQKADSITSTVSSTYATKDSVASLETWKKEASQKITDSAIISTVSSSSAWNKKADKASLISQINQSAESVSISASKIKLEGIVTANNYFTINADGSIKVVSGKIAGWDIKKNTLSSGNIVLNSEDETITIGEGEYRTRLGNFTTEMSAAEIGVLYLENLQFGSNGEDEASIVFQHGGSGYTNVAAFNIATQFRKSVKIMNLKHVTSGGHLVFASDGTTLAYLASSSKRYKKHIANMTLSEAKKILNIPIVWFSYKNGYLAADDSMAGKRVPGMYAEDVGKYYPEGAFCDGAGIIENWNERMIIPAMLKLIQNLYEVK